MPIEITHNVFNRNTFISQNLNTQVEYKTQHLPKHISLVSLTCLRKKLLTQDSKLQHFF